MKTPYIRQDSVRPFRYPDGQPDTVLFECLVALTQGRRLQITSADLEFRPKRNHTVEVRRLSKPAQREDMDLVTAAVRASRLIRFDRQTTLRQRAPQQDAVG